MEQTKQQNQNSAPENQSWQAVEKAFEARKSQKKVIGKSEG